MFKIDFTGAGQYWLSCPEQTDGNRGVAGGGALWIDLCECETEADLLAAALAENASSWIDRRKCNGPYPDEGTRPAPAREFRQTADAAQRAGWMDGGGGGRG